MGRRRVLLLFALLGLAGPAPAGVYVALRPALPPLPEASGVRLYLSELRFVPLPLGSGQSEDPDSFRAAVRQRVAELLPRKLDGSLGLLERIDLSACYIRLRQFNEAIQVLRGADQKHFMVLANQATAFFELGELDRAVSYQEQALANWPPVWAGWNAQQWAWYRRCELHFKRLLELRRAEQQLGRGGRPAPVTTFDPLFPGLKLAGADAFEAGPLPRVADDLPPDAVRIVFQLVAWLPFDDRLTWLFAELLNISGQLDLAYTLMDELVYARNWTNVRELRQHLLVLRAAKEAWSQVTPEDLEKELWRVAPRGLPGVPGLGAAAAECAWPAAELFLRFSRDPSQQLRLGSGAAAAPAAPAASSSGLPDLRTFLVGVGAGAVLALLTALQFRQSLRRRS